MTSHTTWRCHALPTAVGTSVGPAEYRIAKPMATSTTTIQIRPRSKLRWAIATGCGGRVRENRHGLGGRGAGGPQRVRPGRARDRAGAQEVARDDPTHQWSDSRSVLGELDGCSHHDLRIVFGRE